MARKQRIKLASDAEPAPPGMSAFIDVLNAPVEERSPRRTWPSPSTYYHCSLFPYRCRSVEDHGRHPTALELARTSGEPAVLRRLASSPSPAVLEVLLGRPDVSAAVICEALSNGGLYSIDRDAVALLALTRPDLQRPVLELLCSAPLSGEVLLGVCEHPAADDRLRAYAAACVAAPTFSSTDREGRRYVVRSSTGLWGRAAWSLVTADHALAPAAAVRRAKPVAKAPNGDVVVETLEALAPEWHGTVDELCRTAGLLAV